MIHNKRSRLAFVMMMIVALALAALPAAPTSAAATRLYLQNVASSVTTTNQGGWDSASGYPTLVMSSTKSGTINNRGVAETSSTNNYDVLLLKFVSEPMIAQNLTAGTLTWVIGAQESATQANDSYHVHAYVVSNDGSTVRGTLLSNNIDTVEWSTTAAGTAPAGAKTLSAVTAQAGDRIVIEIGYHAQNGLTTSFTGNLWYGGTGGDLTNNGDETANTGWFEFSQGITFDSTAPAAPTVSSTSPASPANNNSPKVIGSAEAGSTVKLYTNSTCTSAVAATDTAANFASPGITVAVSDNTTTDFYATATDAALNVSSCSSTHVTYVEDSAAPVVTVTTFPTVNNGNKAAVTLSGACEDGLAVALAVTDVGSLHTVNATPTCTSGAWTASALDLSGLNDGTLTATATQTDAAGNLGSGTKTATKNVVVTVTFNSNGGTGTMSNQTANVPTALTLNTFTRTGYSFSGWNTAANGSGTAYANGATYSFAADVTLYAQWTALANHTVTFNANGGTGTMSNQVANVPTALTLNAFTRAGYSFTGWNTAANGSGTAYANGATYSFAADVTLYAQWKTYIYLPLIARSLTAQ